MGIITVTMSLDEYNELRDSKIKLEKHNEEILDVNEKLNKETQDLCTIITSKDELIEQASATNEKLTTENQDLLIRLQEYQNQQDKKEPEPAPEPKPTPDPIPTPEPEPTPAPEPEPTPDPWPAPYPVPPIPEPEPEPITDETKKINWKKIWSFIKSKLFIALVVIGLIGLNAIQYSRIKNFKRQKDISDQNFIAINDSLEYEKLKNGNLQVSIASYIASEKDLKDLNKNLADEVKAQKGKVIFLTHAVIQLRQDTSMLKKYLVEKDSMIQKLLKIDDDTYVAPWTLTYRYDSTNFDIFTGNTYINVAKKDPLELVHINTELVKRESQIDLIWGQKVEKGLLRVFVQSAYPGFTVAEMQGVLIDPSTNPYFKNLMKKKHLFSGFSVGIGASGGFNVTDGKYGLVVGPSIVWNIYSF